MKRRDVLAAAGLLLAGPVLGQAPRPRRIGVVRPGRRPPEGDVQIVGLAAALRELGHVEGVNLVIEHRFADGRPESLAAVFTELLRAGVDVLVPVGVTATLAARQATATVPIIAFANVDPVAAGLADQLGRPSGNVTGILVAPEGSLAAKRLALLREAAPLARRFALLAPEADPAFAFQIREMRDAASLARIDLVIVGDRNGAYDAAFAEMAQAGVDAVVVGAHQFYVRDRREIIVLAERQRLPAIYEWAHQVADGGLMSFGASLTERYRRLAAHIDRILKGARPADLPFEQPAALMTVVNLRAARAIGLQLSPAFLARADEVID